MGEGHQAEVSGLAVVGAAANEVALAAFDRRDDGFHLAAAAVGRSVEARPHQSAIAAARQLIGGPTVFGRDYGAHLMPLTRERMIWFRVEAGIGREFG